jgi:hypothetical protein
MTSGPFDFPSAEIPSARALRDSFAHDEIEAELQALFLELFERLASDAFDADVLGAPHLGSFELVRRMVNHDGLVLLRGAHEKAATRYLYRAWKSGDVQKRGLHFLRTYLQLLLPNQVQVRQLWHDRRFPYGEAFRSNEPREIFYRFLSEPSLRLDGTWQLGRTSVPLGAPPPIHRPDERALFLTSRIDIVLSLEAMADSAYLLPGSRRGVLGALLEVIRAIVPARLVPMFRFWLAFVLIIRALISYRLRMHKSVSMRFSWCGRVITESVDARWALGRDPWPVRLPQPFGSFRVGERRGDPWTWRLRGCRIEAPMTARLRGADDVYRLPALERWRRLNGSWALSRRRSTALTAARLLQRATIGRPAAVSTIHRDWIRLDYPRTPTRLGRMLLVDGRWRLGAGETLRSVYCAMGGRYLDGCRPRGVLRTPQLSGLWRLARAPSIPAESVSLARLAAPIHVRPDRLLTNPRHACIRQAQPYRLGLFALRRDGAPRPVPEPERRLRLNGWRLGRPSAPLVSMLALRKTALPVEPAANWAGVRRHAIGLSIPSAPKRLGVGRRLDGRWRVEPGERLSSALRGPCLTGWALGRNQPIGVSSRALARRVAAVTPCPERLMPNAGVRDRHLRLSGWPLGRQPAAPTVVHHHLRRLEVSVSVAGEGKRALSDRLTLDLSGLARRLGLQRALDGRWKLCAGERLAPIVDAPRLTGWPLNRSTPVASDRTACLVMRSEATAAPARLARQYSTRLRSWPRRLDGRWSLGAAARIGRFCLDGSVALKNRKISQFHRLGTFTLRPDHNAARHWPVHDERAQGRCVQRLNGRWRIGGPSGALEASIRIIKRDPRTAYG